MRTFIAAVAVSGLALASSIANASNEQVSVSQAMNGHIIAHVSADLTQGCAASPLILQPELYPPAHSFLVTTNVAPCGLDTTPAHYTASADLGVVPDGDYVVWWGYVEGVFGLVGTPASQRFSIRASALVSTTPIPSLSLSALIGLAVVVAAIGALLHRRRWV